MLTVVSAASVAAGQRQPRTGPPAGSHRSAAGDAGPPEGAINAGQIQRWFEAFTVLQAQEALQLSEAQYGRFVTRLKALQDTRRSISSPATRSWATCAG